MNIETGVALLLLLVCSSLEQYTTYAEKARDGAFVRLMTKYNETQDTLVKHEDVDQDLQSQLDQLTQKYNDQESKYEDLRKEVHGHVYHCPSPAINNIETGTIKRHEGAKVDYTCTTGYFKCEEDDTLTCQADKTWTASTCSQMFGSFSNPPIKHDITFGTYATNGLPSGSSVIVKGKPTHDYWFAINLYDLKSDIILHASFRTNAYGAREQLVINKKLSGRYQSEYRPSLSTWPVARNRNFTYLVKVLDTQFEVYVDNKKLFSYSHYGKRVTKAQVYGYATYFSVLAFVC